MSDLQRSVENLQAGARPRDAQCGEPLLRHTTDFAVIAELESRSQWM